MIHAYVEPHENTNPEMIKNIKKMYIDAANQNYCGALISQVNSS